MWCADGRSDDFESLWCFCMFRGFGLWACSEDVLCLGLFAFDVVCLCICSLELFGFDVLFIFWFGFLGVYRLLWVLVIVGVFD